jgi:hypothetical protein
MLPLLLAMMEVFPPGSALASLVNTYFGWVLVLVGPSAIILAVIGLSRRRGSSMHWASKCLAWCGIVLGLMAGAIGAGLIWLNYAFRDFQFMGD